VHPSWVLRQEPAKRDAGYQLFREDLRRLTERP